jgi:hypothetical protein
MKIILRKKTKTSLFGVLLFIVIMFLLSSCESSPSQPFPPPQGYSSWGQYYEDYNNKYSANTMSTSQTKIISTTTPNVTTSDTSKSKIPLIITPTIKIGSIDNFSFRMVIDGSDFQANALVSFTWDTISIGSVNTNELGWCYISFTIPPGTTRETGPHSIKATDGVKSATLDYTIIVPLRPFIQSFKVTTEYPVSFSWVEIHSLSTYSYVLQIATDPTFTDNSIIINKTRISHSYRLETVEEKKLTLNVVYYWRMKAIDENNRYSEWSEIRDFSIVEK